MALLSRERYSEVDIIVCDATPEGDIAAPVGSMALSTEGVLYTKTSGTGNTGWSSEAPVLTGNTLWVDAVNGDDTTGTTGRQDLPFLTPEAAVAAATAGDLIDVRPGAYLITGNLWKDGVSITLSDGAVLTQDSAPIFVDSGVAGSVSISGRGVISTAGSELINLTGGSTMNIQCKQIGHSNPLSAIASADVATLFIEADICRGVVQLTDGTYDCDAFLVDGGCTVQGGADGSAFVSANRVTNGFFYAVDPVGDHSLEVSCLNIQAQEITNSGGILRLRADVVNATLIQTDSGITEFYGSQISTPNGILLTDYLSNSKSVRFVSARITTTTGGSPIEFSGTNPTTLILANSQLVAIGGADSIDASTPLTATSYGSYANTATDVNVTIDGLLTVGAYVQ